MHAELSARTGLHAHSSRRLVVQHVNIHYSRTVKKASTADRWPATLYIHVAKATKDNRIGPVHNTILSTGTTTTV